MNLKPILQTKLYGMDLIFDEIVSLFNSNKLPTNILFSGSKGSGKSTMAYHFINYISSINEDHSYDIKSNKIEQAAKITGQDRDIEDLWVPFFATATDLTNSKLIIFDKGPIWEGIRSSGALPGMVLPHFMNENIIVDGGLLIRQ